ncbi:hypothetical protein D3C73_548170 [compost metagenome]
MPARIFPIDPYIREIVDAEESKLCRLPLKRAIHLKMLAVPYPALITRLVTLVLRSAQRFVSCALILRERQRLAGPAGIVVAGLLSAARLFFKAGSSGAVPGCC